MKLNIKTKLYQTNYILILICFLSIVTSWLISYFDYVNMVNNGYINKKSISFRLEEMNKPFNPNLSGYILMQYDNERLSPKYVYINGDVKLPPIIKNNNFNIDKDIDSHAAIVGASASIESIPNGYTITGTFDTSHSYRLSSDIWLLSRIEELHLDKGHYFIFTSPSSSPEDKLSALMNGNPYEVLSMQNYGTYSLASNSLFQNILWALYLFFLLIALAHTINGHRKDGKLITVLYYSGFSTYRLIWIMIKLRLFSFMLISIFLVISCVLLNRYIYSLWDTSWLLYSFCFIGFQSLSIIIASISTSCQYSVKKEGHRF
ncbi:hypothetical protein DFQ01_102133 [Paenibacillus cellulosilyticus]|uniref:MacB-like protein n=1 Tax=Paenibacillus cellulosilyticus TaxID=375489 RepID=A0A2V2Z128_9BACL|nr:hypothetical protein [Paenibacillus cellulosilyticus]PWW07241.1 hypothetical protein DFQ01_102133 [Paenibacillus cellulosilyticus]QKS44568.1 hypothetical protein HUB94_09190 [Paenibacillus cellulosilyticus]